MRLIVHTDGGSLNNPGQAAYSFIIRDEHNKIIHQYAKKIGVATNNKAEYYGVIEALKYIKKALPSIRSIKQLSFFSDSSLLVNQLNGLFKVKSGDIRGFILQIRTLEGEINVPATYAYVPREKNSEADSLVKAVLASSLF